MRFIFICVVLLIVMFAGHSMYNRTKADKQLSKALGAIPNHPAAAYKHIQPILDYNDAVSLGKISKSAVRFRDSLSKGIVELLESRPAPADTSFLLAAAALDVLDQLGQDSTTDTTAAKSKIVQAARDSMEAVRDHGELNAWDTLVAFFNKLGTEGRIPPDAFDNFQQWMAAVRAVERRPIGLRNAIEHATQHTQNALRKVGIAMPAAQGVYVAAPPAVLDDYDLIEAELLLNQAQGAIGFFEGQFKEPGTPPELMGLRAKIEHNKGAFKLAHLMQQGRRLREYSSSYIAELTISPKSAATPTTMEMFGAFVNGSRSELQAAQRLFQQSSLLASDHRNAYSALAAWNEAWLLELNNQNPAAARAAAASWGTQVNGPARSIVDAMSASERVLLIVEIP